MNWAGSLGQVDSGARMKVGGRRVTTAPLRDVQAALRVSFSVLTHRTPGPQGPWPLFSGSGAQQRCGAPLHTHAPAHSALRGAWGVGDIPGLIELNSADEIFVTYNWMSGCCMFTFHK